jgi:hypothetical protein
VLPQCPQRRHADTVTPATRWDLGVVTLHTCT